MVHVMIDIEGLSLYAPTNPVMNIAVVPFDENGVIEHHGFLDVFIRDWPGTAQPATVQWWQEQPNWEEMQQLVRGGVSTDDALMMVSSFISELNSQYGDVAVWANHPTYDLTSIQAGCYWKGVPRPWPHTAERDYATAIAPYLDRLNKPTPSHWAHQDCLDQIKVLCIATTMGLVLA